MKNDPKSCPLYPVHPSLQRFIRSYTLLHTAPKQSLHTLNVAKTDSVLLFTMGDTPRVAANFNLYYHPEQTFTFYSHEVWLGGLLNQPLHSDIKANSAIVCVIFTPFGVHNFIQESTPNVLNKGYSTTTLNLHQHFEALVEQLRTIHSGTQAVQLVEEHLLRYYYGLKIPFSLKDMSPVTAYIMSRNGIVTVKQLEEKFRISRRWLEKQFAVQVGVSPKEFARIYRFTCMLKKVTNTPSATWGTLLEDFGYYDQSHLNKDFQEFAGYTPTQYLQHSSPDINNIFLKTIK
jgi:AraC-like DNA-binding protein